MKAVIYDTRSVVGSIANGEVHKTYPLCRRELHVTVTRSDGRSVIKNSSTFVSRIIYPALGSSQ